MSNKPKPKKHQLAPVSKTVMGSITERVLKMGASLIWPGDSQDRDRFGSNDPHIRK